MARGHKSFTMAQIERLKQLFRERPNNIQQLLESHPSIRRIVINGKSKARDYFDKYFYDLHKSSIEIITVESSSNANSIGFETKLEDWKKILK